MRIPTYDSPRVDQRPISEPSVQSRVKTDSLGDDLQRGGQGLARIGQSIDREQRQQTEVQEKANAAAVTEMQTRLQDEYITVMDGDVRADAAEGGQLTIEQILSAGGGAPTSAEGLEGATVPTAVAKKPGGFLQTRGRQASAQSVETVERLEKLREDLAKELSSDDARKLFLMRTGGMYEGARQKVQDHTNKENQLADVDAVEALKRSSLASISTATSDEEVERFAAAPEGPMQRLTGAGEVDLQKWRSEVAESRIERALSPKVKDWQRAEELLEKSKGTLDPKKAEALAAKAERYRLDAEAHELARKAAVLATKPNGTLDENEADAKLFAIPDERLRELAQSELDQEKTRRRGSWQQEIHNQYNLAGSAYEKTGQPDADAMGWLRDNAYDQYRKLKGEFASDRKQRLALAGKPAREKAKSLSAADQHLLTLVKLKAWDGDYSTSPATLAREKGIVVSEAGKDKALEHQRALASKDQKGSTAPLRAFVGEAMNRTAAGWGKEKKAKFREEMVAQFYDAQAGNGDKPVTKEQAERIIVDARNAAEMEYPGVAGVVGNLFGAKKDVEAWQKGAADRRDKKPPPEPPPASDAIVPVVSETGVPGKVRADKVEAWLQANPKRKRR